ncbi:T9SS type A sorting domain-containing protein [candidate division KSB1 bacterium]|nr:T9SS type A sorting domain-containing protein [candidate division KSB1 bacterium]
MNAKLYITLSVFVLHAVAAQGNTHAVDILNYAFAPVEITVQPGDTVVWTNSDQAPHTVTATDNSFDSGFMGTNDNFAHAFNQMGSFAYVCAYHSNMTGVVNVGTAGGGDTTWTEQTSPTTFPLNDIRFWDESIGWIAADAGVLRTTNGGQNWTLVPTSDDCEAVYFVSATEGWACGNDGMMLHSTNGGVSWTSQTSGAPDKLRDVWFADNQNGWAAGRDGILIHTTNGGATWSPQSSPATDDLRGIHMLDSQSGWIVGSRGLILFTSDGGANWETQLSVPDGEEDEFEAVFALDSERAWVTGGQGRVYHTLDGGLSWTPQTSGTTVALMDIQAADPNMVWLCGAGGFLANTDDGGEMWHAQLPPAVATFNSVFFVNAQTGYLVTGDGRIFKRSITLNPAPGERHAAHPGAPALAANYPNPFNPVTTIAFTLPAAGHVSLRVFDVIGREVATPVDGLLAAGAHQIPFSGSDLPSGVYFYQLTAAGSMQTRKMTLLK